MSRRKAEMVLELVDRATRPARRFIALQRRMGRAVEMANRMAQRSSRAAQRATDLYKRAVQGLGRAQDALQRGIRRSNDLIRRQVTQMRTATGLMRGGVMGMGRAALLAGGMFTAYAGTVSLAGTAMLGPARQFEKFQTILTTTEGTAQAAQEAMGWVQDFAVSTPYELDQVMAAFVQLRSYGLDPTNGLLRTLGDTSAAMGKDVMQAVEAIADAVTGENERLKEFGIKASKVGDYFEYAYSVDGVEKTVRAMADDRAAIEAALTSIFNERFGGAMELQAQTFDGMLSNIMDQWAKFQLMIMSNGVFDWMKSKMRLVLDELDRLAASGELEAWAKAIADNILTGLNAIWEFGAAAGLCCIN
ncbi:tape measure protein [Tateyamaria sp.]|uniref:tape measure protein n=1 Tax=Tateyamaria sp. TaxID=1929288 RepID=UPI003B21360A